MKKNRGFTVIEILVAMLIVTILMGIGIVSTRQTRERALMALLMEDSRQIKEGAGRFSQDCGFMPPDVAAGIDPGLASADGFAGGDHSASWDDADMTCWNGPHVREWRHNPWGGLYDWDSFPRNYAAWGIPGGGNYLTLKPASWGGRDGMPSEDIERALQESGADKAQTIGVVALWMGASLDAAPAAD